MPAQFCDLFIAYRQGTDEGDACASWLHDNLDGTPIQLNDERLVTVRIYWDRDAPAIPDWRAQWRMALKTCRALILVCSTGTRERRQPQDWLFDEIDWWLSHRRTAPLLIDTGCGSTCVPSRVAKRWPYTQRLLWNAAGSESERLRVIDQIQDGIVISESGIRNEELTSSIRKKRVITGLSIGLFYLLIFVSILAVIKWALSGCIDSVNSWAHGNSHIGPGSFEGPLGVCERADSLVLIAEILGVLASILSALLIAIWWMISWFRRRKRPI